jgi:glucokinase
MSKIVGRLDLIKKMNRQLVVEQIRSLQPISRAQIAKDLNLSKSTVSTIVEDLLKRKLIVEVGEGESTKEGGRRGLLLGFNPKSAYGIGVDIGGTKILIIITDLDGNMVYREKRKTTNDIDEIVQFIRECLQKADISEADVFGMGIGVPGTTNNEEGIVKGSVQLDWVNFPFKKLIEPYFPFPVFINNDVNCSALGERWLGAGGNSDHIYFISIGTAVGSAIIANGNLVYGHNYTAGEVCFQISIDDIQNNRFNLPNDYGVFEKKISGTALSQHGYTTEEIFSEYAKGNERVIPVIKDFILHLSIVLANVVSLLNPEKVVIGGGVSESMGIILDDIQDKVACLTPIQTKIELASLGGDAGALGAIAYAFNQLEEANLL